MKELMRRRFTTIPVLVLFGTYPITMANALPQNPERPFAARTCEEARARYSEAQNFSPLISHDENTQVLEKARQQMERLCAGEPEDGSGRQSDTE